MRIGIRAHDMEQAPFEELVKNIHKKGFFCTHIALKKSIQEFSVDEEAMTPGMALYMKQVFAENKVDVAVLGCYLNLANPNPEKLRKIIDTYKAHIRFAAWLGCGVVGTETGAVNEEYRYEEANHSEEALQIFIQNVKEVVTYAEKMGVVLAIEPVYKHIVYNNQRARQVLDAIASPNLQIIFDPVNQISLKNYTKQDEIIQSAFELLGKEIAVIHAKDFIIENDMVKSVAAGKGRFHYEPLIKLIKEKKPFIHVTLEDTVPENVFEAKGYLEELYAKA